MPETDTRAENSDRAGLPATSALVPYLVLFFAPCLIYWKTVGFEFIPTWDDGRYILNNPIVHQLSLENLIRIFTSSTATDFYHPLHVLSHAIDYALWGTDPAGYHITNVILHGINSCLAYLTVRAITNQERVALFVALLFAVHPINVEDVAWISERKTLLSTLFFFASLLSYFSYLRTGRTGKYALSLVFFALSLLAKVFTLPLPLVLVAYELLLTRHRIGWTRIAPFFVVSGAVFALSLYLYSSNSIAEQSALSADVLFGVVYPSMMPVFWKYIGLLLWPARLSGYYDTTLYFSFLQFPVIAALSLWALVTAAVFYKGSAQLRFWYLWFWICLLPASNIIPNLTYYADRYMYTPAIGIFVVAALGAKSFSAYVSAGRPRRQTVLALAAAAIIAAYGIAAYQRVDVWRNELTFWQDTAAKSPNMYKARLNLGVAFHNAQRLGEAEREYLAALRIHNGPEVRMNLALLRGKRRLDRADPAKAPAQ